MNIIFTIAVVIVLCPWILMVLFCPIMYLLLHVIPILNNFYTLLINLILISLLCKIKGLCA